ncbi:aminoglycoside 6'-N-acetyltransferase [Thermoactinomyces sp. DSM 45891]|uniref:GNAT family N-acetyltransferase n=1 Tax=Thermoactinomyces sp. DSM 45891 TaxID=1761907 RepID=UPI0009202303|nr:GNAT family N-acetyltransferase [Thermoactinomyces sp. DSM 45891]SFX61522.1 aminoglycoside 6'-N-acetyltransferase [Thermoactinomyces sp. DSM 45891]
MIKSGPLTIRLVSEDDVAILSKWLTNPDVLYFYEGRDQPQSPEQVRKQYLNHDESSRNCIVEYDNKPIGYIQFYPLTDHDKQKTGYSKEPNVWGMDQFIGETDYWNKGVGTRLVSCMVGYLVREIGAKAIIMDPQTRNKRAIRCYEKCGFKKLSFLPNHELHEGIHEDCWLLEYGMNDE